MARATHTKSKTESEAEVELEATLSPDEVGETSVQAVAPVESDAEQVVTTEGEAQEKPAERPARPEGTAWYDEHSYSG